MQEKQKFIKIKSQDGRRLFRVRIFSLQTHYLPSASCKVCLLCCYNTAAKAFPKLCHVVREGERKETLFPLSKMAEGRGIAAMSREEEWCSPSCSKGGLGDSASISPSFPSPHSYPLSHQPSQSTNGIQLCCQSVTNSIWPTMQVEGYACKRVRLIWLIVCIPHPNTVFLLMLYALFTCL